jgi:hypothetical protein
MSGSVRNPLRLRLRGFSRLLRANGAPSLVFSVATNAALYAQLGMLEPSSIDVRNSGGHAGLTKCSAGECFPATAPLAFTLGGSLFTTSGICLCRSCRALFASPQAVSPRRLRATDRTEAVSSCFGLPLFGGQCAPCCHTLARVCLQCSTPSTSGLPDTRGVTSLANIALLALYCKHSKKLTTYPRIRKQQDD